MKTMRFILVFNIFVAVFAHAAPMLIYMPNTRMSL
jgi:hypothetical protein